LLAWADTVGAELFAHRGCPNNDPAATIVPTIPLAKLKFGDFDLVIDFMVFSP
jgi:hypothetical protein